MSTAGIRVRLAPGALPGDGIPETWVDVSDRVRYLRTTFGRSQELDRIEAATVKIVFKNMDARFTPGNSTSDLVGLRLNTAIEVEYTADADVYPFTLGSSALGEATLYDDPPVTERVFRGLITGFTPEWKDSADGGYAAMTVDATDYFAWLQKRNLTLEAFPQQTVGERIAAVLTAVGNPFPVDIDAAGLTIAAETKTGNALEYLKDLAALDAGLFYVRGGTFVFKSRATIVEGDSYITSQATLGDQEGEFRGVALYMSLDDSYIYNRIVGKTSAGVAIDPQEDAESQSYYLPREKDYGTTAIVNVDDLTNRAAYELYASCGARWRIDGIEFNLRDPSLDSLSLVSLDLLDRVTVTRRPSSGDAISLECHVQGLTHEVTPDSWMLTIQVAAAPEGWLLGTSKLGETTVL